MIKSIYFVHGGMTRPEFAANNECVPVKPSDPGLEIRNFN